MSALLQITGIDTAYGQSQVLSEVHLEIQPGSAHALLGRNGMGKTTLVRSIMGLTPPRRGQILFLGQRIDGLSTSEIARLGIAVVPEGRQIFPNLSVRENLTAFAATRSGTGHWTFDRVMAMFPRLGERAANMGN
ncbi:MAG: ATP-binding cassette domain-containing protein, partial [Comamonadaceae bacterium]